MEMIGSFCCLVYLYTKITAFKTGNSNFLFFLQNGGVGWGEMAKHMYSAGT